jgi:DNA-binding beta-propeller fold protein YncE
MPALSAARRWRLAMVAVALAVSVGITAAATCSRTSAPRAVVRQSVWRAAIAGPGVRHFEYVFPDGQMYVYDIDHGFKLVKREALPTGDGARGVAVNPGTHTLYVSHGSDTGGGHGWLLAVDLLNGRVLWNRSYSHGIDSMALNATGTRIYMPDGELSSDGVWYVLDAATGKDLASIDTGAGTADNGPHNTVVGASGRYVYLGDRNLAHSGSNYLYVASAATNRIVRRIGPLKSGVRPFTVNGRDTLAYTTATGFLGFQVSSVVTGKVLYTTTFGTRFRYDPASFAPTAPSHGIALTPDERQLWVLDGPNSYVHAFDVSGVPGRPPRPIADVKLAHRLTGSEAGCAYDCARDGWVQPSVSGCYVFVGDAGDVINTRTDRVVGFLPAMRDSRKMIEVDWRNGRPFATSTRSGIGRVTGRPLPPPTCG